MTTVETGRNGARTAVLSPVAAAEPSRQKRLRLMTESTVLPPQTMRPGLQPSIPASHHATSTNDAAWAESYANGPLAWLVDSTCFLLSPVFWSIARSVQCTANLGIGILLRGLTPRHVWGPWTMLPPRTMRPGLSPMQTGHWPGLWTQPVSCSHRYFGPQHAVSSAPPTLALASCSGDSLPGTCGGPCESEVWPAIPSQWPVWMPAHHPPAAPVNGSSDHHPRPVARLGPQASGPFG